MLLGIKYLDNTQMYKEVAFVYIYEEYIEYGVGLKIFSCNISKIQSLEINGQIKIGDVARNSKDFDDTTLSYAEIKCLATGKIKNK